MKFNDLDLKIKVSEVKLSENHLNAITQAVIALVAASIFFLLGKQEKTAIQAPV